MKISTGSTTFAGISYPSYSKSLVCGCWACNPNQSEASVGKALGCNPKGSPTATDQGLIAGASDVALIKKIPSNARPITIECVRRSTSMSDVRTHRARFTENQDSEGTVVIQYWKPRDRLLRSIKLSAICFGMAGVAVFIPGLHFILVPGLLLASPIIGFFTYGQQSAVIGGEGTCPACQSPFKVAKGSSQFPLNDLCTNCQRTIKIELIE